MLRQAGGGNPYRKRCLGCNTWFGLTSKKTFSNHSHPHVLPRTHDSEAEECCIPLSEWDRSDEYQDVVDRAAQLRDDGHEFEVVLPGSDQEEQSINRFDCPKCDNEVEGKPDACPHCGAPYKW